VPGHLFTLSHASCELRYKSGAVTESGGRRRRRDAPRVPATGTRLEAEDATLVGARVARDHSGFTGTGFADFTNASGDSVEWAFNFAAGTYSLVLRYANGGATNRPLRLTVNGRVRDVLDFPPTGGWSRWQEVGLTVDLVQGLNRVKLEAIGSSGGNIDSLTVAHIT
jgi:hypothetical protein